MSTQLIVTFITGVVFIGFLLGVALYILMRKDPRPVPVEAMFIFRVVLALAGAAFAAILPGFLSIEAKATSFALQAGGALAVFVVIYWLNPPNQFQKRLAGPRKPVRHPVKPRNNGL